ncbi:MAG: neutral/alkaline non-lysosomal ceramidase N-terminal domain-containing protein, partial [Bacteroidia bacterium]|nr:neutral/alkaline non-lysosomal ceramidase N-terminal domain-containing protein [Bacteroidia bacterium]
IGELKRLARENRLGTKPFLPYIIPLQLFRIGNFVWTAVPAEFTTIAGRRLRNSILDVLKPHGIEAVYIAGYSNAYTNYVTTFEEYQCQRYEGASTLYGQWTLAVYQTLFRRMASEFTKPAHQRNQISDAQPPVFTKEEIDLRLFEKPLFKVKD